MATAVIYGGLGNQLFKYFAALKLSKLHGTNLYLDLSWYSDATQKQIGTNRRLFELNEFPNITLNLKSPSRLRVLVLNSLQKKFPIEIQSTLGIVSDSNYFQVKRFVISRGNFENFDYLPDLKILQNALSVDKNSNSWLDKTLALAQLEKPICIHVRMTDYRKFNSIYDVLSIGYYTSALKRIQSMIGESPIWLFSDNPHSARDFLKSRIKINRIMPLSSQSSSVDTMVAMSSCRAIISANSTFSWWAGLRGSIYGTAEVVVQPKVYDTIAGEGHSMTVPLSNWFVCEN